MQQKLLEYFDIVRIIKNYNKETFLKDLSAWLTVGIIALPQALAFSILWWLPPEWWLYAAIVAWLVAAIFGWSEHNVTGPTSALAVALALVVSKYDKEMVLVLGIMIWIIQIVLSIAKVGNLVKFIPQPVLVGFSTWVAFLIFWSQVPKMFDVSIWSSESFVEVVEKSWDKLVVLWQHDYKALLIWMCVFVLIIGLNLFKKTKNLPIPLIALLFGTGLYLFSWFDIKTIGSIPSSLPSFHFPTDLDFKDFQALIATSIALWFLASVESLATAQIASKMTWTKFDSNKELLGQWLWNLMAGFFRWIPSTGSFSRTAANVRSGAVTRVSMIIHSVFLIIIVLLFASYSKYIPSVVLAAILLTVAIKMIEKDHIKMIFKSTRADIIIFLATFGTTLVFDLIKAIEIWVFLATIFVLQKVSMKEHIKEVAVKDYKVKFADQIQKPRYCPQLQLIQIDAPLFFWLASYFEEALTSMRKDSAKNVILRMKNVTHIDMSGLVALEEVFIHVKKLGWVIIFSWVNEEVRKVLRKSWLCEHIGKELFVENTEAAIKLFFDKYVDRKVCENCKYKIFKEC